MIANRQLSTAFVCAFIAGNIMGAMSTLGSAELGYIYGISGGWYPAFAALGLIFLAVFIARPMRRTGLYTVPEFIGKTFDNRCRLIFVVMSLITSFIGLPSQIVGGASIITALTGINFIYAEIFTTLIFLAFVVLGGVWSASSVSFMKVLLILTLLYPAPFLAVSVIGGWDILLANTPPTMWRLDTLGVPIIVAWVLSVSTCFVVSQGILQSIFSAKSENSAVIGTFLAAVIEAPIGFLLAILGICAAVTLPGIRPSLALPLFAIKFFNPIYSGAILGAMMLTSIASMSIWLLASATIIGRDIYWHLLKPDATEKEVLLFTRGITVLLAFACLSFAILAPTYIVYYGIAAITIGAAGAFFPVVGGLFWKKTTPTAAFWSTLIGTIAAVLWYILNQPFNIHPIYVSLPLSGVCMILLSFLTPTTKKPETGR
jgi:SSS family solute:Na+ symporter